jgi:uncharacterized protein (DUF1778 family)
VYRFDARLNADQKRLIQRAADLEGRSVTDFVLQSAEEAALRTIERRVSLRATLRDMEFFLNAIENPREPSPRMRKAFGEYRKMMGRGWARRGRRGTGLGRLEPRMIAPTFTAVFRNWTTTSIFRLGKTRGEGRQLAWCLWIRAVRSLDITRCQLTALNAKKCLKPRPGNSRDILACLPRC